MPGNRFSNINKKLHQCEVIQFVPRAARFAPSARRGVDGLTVIVKRGAEVLAQMPIGQQAIGIGFLAKAEYKHAVLDALTIASRFVIEPDEVEDRDAN